MSTTLALARGRLRIMLRELVASFWTNATLDQCIQDADWEVFKKQQRQRKAGYGQLREEVTLPANGTLFSLTPGANPVALTKRLKAILSIEHQGSAGNWNPCFEIPESEEWRLRQQNAVLATADTPPLYRLRRPNILFLPPCAADRLLAIIYRPAAAEVSENVALDTDDDYIPLVLARAAVFAMAYLGQAESVWDAAVVRLEDEMFDDMAAMTSEGRGQTVKLVESPALFNF